MSTSFNYSYGTIDFNIHFIFNKKCNWFTINEIANIFLFGLKYKLTKRQNKLLYVKKQYDIDNNYFKSLNNYDEMDYIVKYPITYIYKCIVGKKTVKHNKNYNEMIKFITNNFDFVSLRIKQMLEEKFKLILEYFDSKIDIKIIGFHPYKSIIDKNITKSLKNYEEENANRISKKFVKNNCVLDLSINY